MRRPERATSELSQQPSVQTSGDESTSSRRPRGAPIAPPPLQRLQAPALQRRAVLPELYIRNPPAPRPEGDAQGEPQPELSLPEPRRPAGLGRPHQDAHRRADPAAPPRTRQERPNIGPALQREEHCGDGPR